MEQQKKGGENKISPAKDRQGYFKDRRKRERQVSFWLPFETVEKLDANLKAKGKTRVEWLKEQIAKELESD